jgi:hypothetical protein
MSKIAWQDCHDYYGDNDKQKCRKCGSNCSPYECEAAALLKELETNPHED